MRASVRSGADVLGGIQTTFFPTLPDAPPALLTHFFTSFCIGYCDKRINMDTDTLIAEVYVRRPIWDKRNKLHANRNVIDTLWKEIAREMQHEEAVLRKKWKYLREKFASEYSKRPVSRSGDAAGNCPPTKWPFFQQLMFLKDIVQTRASTGSITPSSEEPSTASQADNGPAEDDDAASQCSQESFWANQSEDIECPQENQDSASLPADTPHPVQDTLSDVQTPVSSKRKRKSQEDSYYQRMCNIEEKKLELLMEKRSKADADQEDEDLMFLKTLLSHMKKIPQHKKLRFQSRIQSVVEEFAYGSQSQHDQPDANTRYQGYPYSTSPAPVDNCPSHSSSCTPTTSFDYARL